jgi:beta-N-acetylhexosaminidase
MTTTPPRLSFAYAAAVGAQSEANRAWMEPYAGQRELVRRLVAAGKPVVAVAARDPYDIAHFTAVPAYLATFSYTGVSLESAVRVLYGEVAPTGRLPVTIPRADDPTSVLYPFGHGLGS